MDLSIIIPVYNEGRKVDTDIQMASHFLEENKMSGEIIISDDGSTDNTIKIPDKILTQTKVPVKIIENKTHYGKGHAVRSGILNAHGKIILFIDSGACVPYDNLLPGIEMLREGTCDIAHGSRFLPDSFIMRKKQWYRRILSYSFRKFIQLRMKIPFGLTDTQCGLKMYKKEVALELYGPVKTRGFMFDIEVIRHAEQAGYLIKEFPITWTADMDSRLPVVNTFLDLFSELKKIRDLTWK